MNWYHLYKSSNYLPQGNYKWVYDQNTGKAMIGEYDPYNPESHEHGVYHDDLLGALGVDGFDAYMGWMNDGEISLQTYPGPSPKEMSMIIRALEDAEEYRR